MNNKPLGTITIMKHSGVFPKIYDKVMKNLIKNFTTIVSTDYGELVIITYAR